MNRRNFLKAMLSLPIAIGIPETKLLTLALERRRAIRPPPDETAGWINFNEIDETTLANW